MRSLAQKPNFSCSVPMRQESFGLHPDSRYSTSWCLPAMGSPLGLAGADMGGIILLSDWGAPANDSAHRGVKRRIRAPDRNKVLRKGPRYVYVTALCCKFVPVPHDEDHPREAAWHSRHQCRPQLPRLDHP
ncbi:protein of unknown function [Magnetospirillum sp. XM-1]|nr:protein of unknown function [Magnetospirillum sp. XM-1]